MTNIAAIARIGARFMTTGTPDLQPNWWLPVAGKIES